MKVTRTTAFILILSIILIGVVWAEGEQEKSGKADEVTLKFARWTRAPKAWEAYEEAFDRFEQAHPGVKVDANQIPWGDYVDSLIRFAMSGSAPDVFVMYDASLGSFHNMGALYNMDELITSDFKANFYDSMWEYGTVGNSQYGVPFRDGPWVLFYNKDLLRESGVSEEIIMNGPKNHKEFLETALAATKNGKYGYCQTWGDENSMHRFRAFNVSAGNSLLDEEFNATFNNETGIEVLQFMVDLVNKYNVVPPGGIQKSSAMGREEFMSGMVAMLTTNVAQDGVIKDVTFDYGISEIPFPNDHESSAGTIGGFTVHSIAAQTKHPELAWELVKELSTAEFVSEYCEAMSLVPSRKDVIENDPKWDNEKYRLLVKELNKPNSRCLPAHPKIVELSKILQTELQAAVANKKGVEEALDDAAAKWKEIQ